MFRSTRWATIAVSALAAASGADSFARRGTPPARAATPSLAAGADAARPPTLTDETTWRLRLLLNDIRTTGGRKLDGQLFVVEGTFVEEDGYEPPQGLFAPTARAAPPGEEGAPAAAGTALEVSSSRWKLSEDPDDPKDGLWIWGLFKEPQYPFMLLQMETKELALPSSMDGENADSIPPLKLYAQINHIRAKDGESGVELQTANLNVRVLEQIQLPGATVDLFEEEKVGQVQFQVL